MGRIRILDQAQKTPERVPLSSWHPPPEILRLKSDEVHVWYVALDLTVSRVQSLWHFLSADEQKRAERFRFQKDQNRYIVARGLLRTILGRYLTRAPSQLQFCYTSYGKPALVGESGKYALRFNVSHSLDLALYAITRGRELGVDLERLRPDLIDQRIAERFFSPREVATLRTLPANMRQEAFFACWTRKEAYLKARGEGLTLRLDQFDVSLVPGEPAALLGTNGDPQEALRWSLQELFPRSGYVAALAVEGHDWRLTCWQWPE
jgi:4'-phosphopantetheinyl transferase